MKANKVVITVVGESDLPLEELKKIDWVRSGIKIIPTVLLEENVIQLKEKVRYTDGCVSYEYCAPKDKDSDIDSIVIHLRRRPEEVEAMQLDLSLIPFAFQEDGGQECKVN